MLYCLSSESESGEIWYYSTPLQLDELMKKLDDSEMEVALYRELSDYKDEIKRQMELTESITNQLKGNKKSYLEVENGVHYSFFRKFFSFFSALLNFLLFVIHRYHTKDAKRQIGER